MRPSISISFAIPNFEENFSDLAGIYQLEGRILKVTGKEKYLNTDDLADLEGTPVRLYLNPGGCGPNDGIFFSRNAYKTLDAHSLIPEKYTIRLEIFSIGENEIKDDIEIIQ